ncbi:MAG: ribonuclease J [Chloroflexi bacterium]|nr:ribonuclease J [Chloroflexota bacterium]
MDQALRAILLGGVGEVGKNSTVFEYDDQMLMVDAGVKFPEAELLGVDLVIPNFEYVTEAADDLRAIIITHGHEDHIGALPFLVMQLERAEPVPIYGTKMTLGLIATKLKEHRVLDKVKLVEFEPGEILDLDPFTIEPVFVNHSVPGSVGFAIKTPAGTVFHTGDYKFDKNPVDGRSTDEDALRRLGDEGMLALFSDCVRVENPGWTGSESMVSENLEKLIGEAHGRVIVTTFASNLARLRQVVHIAHKLGRRVAVAGRSMDQNLKVAGEIGYLGAPPGTLIDLRESNTIPPNKLVVLATGSQGEPTSVLSRMAMGDHPNIKIIEEDTVIFSAGPIPGNEETVARAIDNLYRRGAKVIYRAINEGVHVSGHSSQDELTHMLGLLRPKYCVPIHGEYRMLVLYKELAVRSGMPSGNILIADIGEVIDIEEDRIELNGTVPSGSVLVDGVTVGEVTSVVLRDRKRLAGDGVLIASIVIDRETGELIGGPDLISRGIVDPRQDAILDEARDVLTDALHKVLRPRRVPGDDRDDESSGNLPSYGFLVGKIREVLSGFIYERIRRRPMILSVVTEV